MRGLAMFTLMIIAGAIILVPTTLSTYISVSEALRLSAVLNANHAIGIINILQISPVETYVTYKLPKGDCELGVEKYVLKFKVDGKDEYQNEIIKSIDVADLDPPIKCDPTKEKTLYFKRCSDGVKISESEGC